MTKQFCTSCRKKKPLKDFLFRSDRPGKTTHNCKACRREYARNHYLGKKSEYKEKHRAYRDKVIAIIQQLKEATPCADCDTFYPYYVMDFDHREDEEKSFLISKATSSIGPEALQKEIDKCDLVCSNCHRVRTHQRRLKKYGCTVYSD